jgi:pimeloyl-ACP methyl ester carboxylesterase
VVALDAPNYGILPGSGSAGLVWEPAAAELEQAAVLPLPDEPSVAAIASALERRVRELPEPRVLVGSSLGALVALELARIVPVDALVLISSGFGIKVSRAVLDRIAADRPGLLDEMAQGVVADRNDRAVIALIAEDFAARGQAVMLHHMQVLASHRPEPLPTPPPTLVLAGMRDPGVPLADHAELALRCRGLLVPIAGSGHLPYLERRGDTVRWIRNAIRIAAVLHGSPRSDPAPIY